MPAKAPKPPPASPDEAANNKLFKARLETADPERCSKGEVCDYARISDPLNVTEALRASVNLCAHHATMIRLVQ
jgi:hypothetical protein